MHIDSINNYLYEPRYRKVESVNSTNLNSDAKFKNDMKSNNEFSKSFKESLDKNNKSKK